MTEIESDFLEFISGKDPALSEIKSHYLKARKQFNFVSPEYKTFILTEIVLRSGYNAQITEGLIDLYNFSERWWLYRYLAYSHQEEVKQKYSTVIQGIIRNSIHPVIVDYGCGLGYISFEIGRRKRCSEIFLVDIDNLILKFTDFHFAKYGIKRNLIRIDKENLYPLLPKHDVCILWEVFEHLKEPLKVFKNIISSLKPSGLLCGDFKNHRPEVFHVSPNLAPVREQIARYFKQINQFVYQRKEVSK